MTSKEQVLIVGALSLLLATFDGRDAHAGSAQTMLPQPFGTIAGVFDGFVAFSGEYELRSQSTSSASAVTMSGRVARRDESWRLEIDMGRLLTNGPFAGQVASDWSGPDDLDSLTNLTMTLVWRPDRSVAWRSYFYPGSPLDGYFEERLRDSPPELMQQRATIMKLGRETIGNHPCIVNRFTVSDTAREAQEYRVWNATDLGGFPIQILWDERATTNTLLFKSITLAKPDIGLFDPPGSQKYHPATLLLDSLKAMKKARPAPDDR